MLAVLRNAVLAAMRAHKKVTWVAFWHQANRPTACLQAMHDPASCFEAAHTASDQLTMLIDLV